MWTPADLADIPLADGSVALVWLGQAGFILRGGGVTMLLDPFIAAHPDRLRPPPFEPAQARGVDLVLCTHEHLDHLDSDALPGIAAASPEARFVVPRPIVDQVVRLGIAAERVLDAQPDAPLRLGAVTVHPVPACHGVDVADAYTFGQELSGGLYRYLGFVVEVGGARVYHAGDTIAYGGMVERLRALRPQVALLPINGRDAAREARNIVGNLDHREAANVADGIGAELLVPMHYDMFAYNLGFPAHLVDVVGREHPALSVLVPGLARPFVWSSAAAGTPG
jgi:L-ascorbate 6-phosphate lactonase